MNETWFKIIESATSPGNILISLLITIFSSVVIGIIFYKSLRNTTRDAFLGFIISEVILLLLLFSVRNNVKSERLEYIQKAMLSINPSSFSCNYTDTDISDWRTGLKCIKLCPKEIGYYIKTCDILEREKDFESAATLIELGLDFIKISPPPTQLCERRKRYYDILPNRPRLDDECNKIHY